MAQDNYLQRLFSSRTPENERLRVNCRLLHEVSMYRRDRPAVTTGSPSERDAKMTPHLRPAL